MKSPHLQRAFAAAVCCLVLAAPALAQSEDHKEKVLVGPLTLESLLDLPGWFGPDFARYMPGQPELEQLAPLMKGVEIVCLLGTWCEDSQREVPRMIRILQSLRDFDPSRLTLIGVTKDKQSPGGEHIRYKLEKVSTFIILKDGEEKGRIVETPIGTIERDLLAILSGHSVAPPPPVQTITDPAMIPPPVTMPDGAAPNQAGETPPAPVPAPPPADRK